MLAGALAACGSGSYASSTPLLSSPSVSAKNPPGSSLSPTVEIAPTPASTLTNENWAVVMADPGGYIGAQVALTGRVFNREEDATRVGLQIWTDSADADGNTIVIFPKKGFPIVRIGDEIEVRGMLEGVFTGETEAGTHLDLPQVRAATIRVLSFDTPTRGPKLSGTASGTERLPTSASLPASPTVRSVAPRPYRVAGVGRAGLSVRSGIGANQPRIGVVHEGQLVVVISLGEGWAQVRGDGFTGYVAAVYLAGPLPSAGGPLAKLAPPTSAAPSRRPSASASPLR